MKGQNKQKRRHAGIHTHFLREGLEGGGKRALGLIPNKLGVNRVALQLVTPRDVRHNVTKRVRRRYLCADDVQEVGDGLVEATAKRKKRTNGTKT